MADFQVGGLTPLTSTDYPGCLAAVIFSQGCPWRCGYCHNPHLIPRQTDNLLEWRDALKFLRRRQGLLDGVVFSGGEPTLQGGLADAMREVRDLGFKVGLHTGGPYPARLEEVLPLVDWVGMDIKAPFDAYDIVTGTPESGARALESLRLLVESGVDYECRTTVHPALLPRDALLELAHSLAGLGVRHYVLQEFRPQGCLDSRLSCQSLAGYLGEDLTARIAPLFRSFAVRHT